MESSDTSYALISTSYYSDPLHPVTAFQLALQFHLNCTGLEDEMEQLMMLRELVGATIGFERLARLTGINSKSLHRMLSKTGNPTTKNLVTIISTMKEVLGVYVTVRVDMPKGNNFGEREL
jgi:DNA-binding phage protein